MAQYQYNDSSATLEIILDEGERHPFCPKQKPSCTRDCTYWLNPEIGCSLLRMEDDPQAVFDYWAEIEKTDPACQ